MGVIPGWPRTYPGEAVKHIPKFGIGDVIDTNHDDRGYEIIDIHMDTQGRICYDMQIQKGPIVGHIYHDQPCTMIDETFIFLRSADGLQRVLNKI